MICLVTQGIVGFNLHKTAAEEQAMIVFSEDE
jgi:hypothetical protein